MPRDEIYARTLASVFRVFRGPQKLAVPSSVFEPTSIDMLATRPNAKLSEGSRGIRAPSTTGVKMKGAEALKTTSYGAWRRHSNVSAALEQFAVLVMLS